MIYMTVRQNPVYKQMTIEDFLSTDAPELITDNLANTKTYSFNYPSIKMLRRTNVSGLIKILEDFNAGTEYLRSCERSSLYSTFFIPKRSGKLRRIDSPNAELSNALRNLVVIFSEKFGALYHTSAFAYVKKRCTVDAVRRHQMNNSKWFAKYDLSDFFGSTTLEFTMNQISKIYPFSEVVKIEKGRYELEKAVELAFLNGGLPQGTPFSPFITNVIMIPIDFKLANGLRSFDGQHLVYTRYADDFIISSKYCFDFREVQNFIVDVLEDEGAPFSLNSKKTRYGSSTGRSANWNLGAILDKDNKITIGRSKKQQFMNMVNRYILDKKSGLKWDLEEVQALDGYRSYYSMIEKENIDGIIRRYNDRYGVDVVSMIKEDLRS